MPDILSVSELTWQIKGLLEGQFPALWVEGEISNFATAPSGHCYFTLKDANAQLAAVMFRGLAGKLNFKLADGQQVVAFGEISVYERRGQYQIIVTQLMPKGLGALQLAFEQLKKKLAGEGLFDPARKRPLPLLPRRLGIVTSPTGAAIRDFLNIISRRHPDLHIIINPVRVQGAGAAEEIAAAIDQFNTINDAAVGRARPPGAPSERGQPGGLSLPIDVIIVTRGGGSLEDLWAFNEEIVARALARSRIPTISAVGHEIDFTIADFVADFRAPTPSAAAELVVKAKEEFQTILRQHQQRLDRDLQLRISEARRRLADCVLRHPAELVRQYQQQVDDLIHRLRQATGTMFIRAKRQRVQAQEHRLNTEYARHRQVTRHRLSNLAGKLELLSPNSTLARGYSITRTANGKIVKTIRTVKVGEPVRTLVTDGEFDSVVSRRSE